MRHFQSHFCPVKGKKAKPYLGFSTRAYQHSEGATAAINSGRWYNSVNEFWGRISRMESAGTIKTDLFSIFLNTDFYKSAHLVLFGSTHGCLPYSGNLQGHLATPGPFEENPSHIQSIHWPHLLFDTIPTAPAFDFEPNRHFLIK